MSVRPFETSIQAPDFENAYTQDDNDFCFVDAVLDTQTDAFENSHASSASNAPVAIDDLCAPCADQDALIDSDDLFQPDAQRPVPLTEVKMPTAQEIARHSLTHLPYRRWCRWCVMSRMPNVAHHQLPPYSRAIPLLVLDYCFLRGRDDAVLLTVLVATLYPSRALFAVPCDTKGNDPYVTARLASFLEQSGVHQMTYMCDQEKPLDAMIKHMLMHLNITGEWVGAVPERSAVGESQSNGRAEKSVQQIEDHIRCLKGELEHRIQSRIPSDHAVLKWLVEYSSVILLKYHLQDNGMTAYEYVHGHRAGEKLAYFEKKSTCVFQRRAGQNLT